MNWVEAFVLSKCHYGQLLRNIRFTYTTCLGILRDNPFCLLTFSIRHRAKGQVGYLSY